MPIRDPLRAAAGPLPDHGGGRLGPGDDRGLVHAWCGSVAPPRSSAICWSGITDAVGRSRTSRPRPGDWSTRSRAGRRSTRCEDPPELALGLLAGCLMLNEPPVASRGGRLARGDARPGLPAPPFPGPRRRVRHRAEETGLLALASGELLDACPSWLDGSPLTFELAEEIFLREGRVTADRRSATPARSGSSSSTGSSTGWSCTGGCSSGWPGSGTAPASTSLPASAQILACAARRRAIRGPVSSVRRGL